MKWVYPVAALPVAVTHMAFAQCTPTTNPAANAPGPPPLTSAQAFAAIDAAHVAEGLWAGFPATSQMIETYLPIGYANLTVDQQILGLINAERIIRRLPTIFGPGDVNGANDPFIGNITANHSLLVAQNADTWWGITPTIVHNNAVDGKPTGRETAPLGPPGLVSNGASEIIDVNYSPESAIWDWMYNDADQNWGHRDIILGCSSTLMGAGVAVSPIDTAEFGPNPVPMVFTVDFMTPQAGSTYVAPVLPPPAAPVPCPPVPAPTQWTCPTVVLPKVFSELAGLATLSADGKTINIAANVSVDPLYGAANKVQSFLVFQPANWGQPSGGVASLGAAPQGTGAFACPLTPVLNAQLDPTDPALGDPNAVSSRCVASIPFAGNPVVISISDTFNNLVYTTMTLTPPVQ
nr:hypothetical protein [uncultured Rhodopila sp.]